MDIKDKIKDLMVSRGISMYKLAQTADLTQTCLANWYGKRNYEPSISALEKVCKALGISMAELFCDDTEQMMLVTDESKRLLADWQRLTAEQKNALNIVIKSYLHNGNEKIITGAENENGKTTEE